jgi:hypothetical protein
MEAQVPVEPMGSMLFKGTDVHLHGDGAELCLGGLKPAAISSWQLAIGKTQDQQPPFRVAF